MDPSAAASGARDARARLIESLSRELDAPISADASALARAIAARHRGAVCAVAF
jgi:hypothetical protein